MHIYIYIVIYPKAIYKRGQRKQSNQQKSNDMQVLWQVSVSLTQYT